ncbi:hypothetical protein [Actinospica robiniae]|uniref:hypothetical protein n=1 Tax=Actinospica robiniae TaxID=304901 RepID=UPI00040A46D7|nr:hypothetical protein [Actinospica robiniae]
MRNLQEPRDAASEHLDDEGVSECAFSPEQAAPGALEHASGCADCSARIEELGRLLTSLADLPEPEIPESVLIRLEATVERAWREADAEAEQKTRTEQRRPRAKAWRPLVVPTAALAVIVGVVVALSSLLHAGGTASTSNSAGAPAGAAAGSTTSRAVRPMGQSELTTMVIAALDGTSGSESTATVSSPKSPAMATCFRAPARAGYTVAAVAPEAYSGGDASLVVYRNDEEPASTTTFYAVLYAGSCPGSTSQVLDEGLVSVSR